MRHVFAILAVFALALPASADGGWVNCFSIQLTWNGETPAVAGTAGDYTDGGEFAMDYTLEGSTLTVGGQTVELDTSVIDVTACEDGSLFTNGTIPGQEPSWDPGDVETPPTTTTQPVQPEATQETIDTDQYDDLVDLIVTLVRLSLIF